MSTLPAISLLEDLPLHLLEEVCEHLVSNNIHRSLSALSLTCRRLYSATARAQYRAVKIEFVDEDDLMRAVERWRDFLQARGCARYLQKLVLVERESWNDGLQAIWHPEVLPGHAGHDLFPRAPDGAWPLDFDDDFWTRPESIPFDPYVEDPRDRKEDIDPGAWHPLVGLIPILTGLRDVYYQCYCQMPASLLSALHEHPSRVRLHICGFHLRSLQQFEGSLHDIDADEYMLAASPCLTSIRSVLPPTSYPYGLDGSVCFNKDAVWEMVQGLAPSLKSVSIEWGSPPWIHDEYSDPALMSGPEWPGFFSEQASDLGSGRSRDAGPVLRGALESIGIGGPLLLNVEYMSKWERYTDFSVLRSLHLRTTGMEVSVLDDLSNISEADGLRSLRCLSLWTGERWNDAAGDVVRVDPSLARLLRSLRPLDTLELTGILGEGAFDGVLRSHGESLRRLRLVPTRVPSPVVRPFVLSRGRVEALVRACPGITDLELLVPRRTGDEEEARTYRALSGLRQLHRLSLRLDCSGVQENADSVRGGADGPYWQVRDLHDGAINVNVDVVLAAEIFNAICGHRSPRLIRLYPAEIGPPARGGGLVDNLYRPALCLSRVWIRVRVGLEREFEAVELRARHAERLEAEVNESTRGPCSFLLDVWPDSGGDLRKMPSYPLWDGD